jgi:hypothetical protein
MGVPTAALNLSTTARDFVASTPPNVESERGLLRRWAAALMEGRRRKAARHLAEYLRDHSRRDVVTVELERHVLGRI